MRELLRWPDGYLAAMSKENRSIRGRPLDVDEGDVPLEHCPTCDQWFDPLDFTLVLYHGLQDEHEPLVSTEKH